MKKKNIFNFIVSITILLTNSCFDSKSNAEEVQNKNLHNIDIDKRYKGEVNAPDFPSNLDWLNTKSPISLRDLRGKFVILDFWTYCCINCMHIIPDLKKLEKKYDKELVVIGVHSAKFENEKDTENIRNAVLRYEIEHPVVNDKNFKIWSDYAARAWPTVVLINPNGKVIQTFSGEGFYYDMDTILTNAIKEFDRFNLINRNPFEISLENKKENNSILSFPSKVFADSKSNILFISDTNHNRILKVNLNNNEIESIIGSGNKGLKDGDFSNSEFNHPQGMFFKTEENILYVADTENHALREINFNTNKVKTVAGNGKQAFWKSGGGVGTEAKLNSPWDITELDNKLFIAMAGSHQIWIYDYKTSEINPFIGTGAENIKDGPRGLALLAQPSGITHDGEKLYFADSEVSAIRSSFITGIGYVRTLVGKGLFEFGDKDGFGDDALLQHPLGITYNNGKLYIADTYNSKIKEIDINNKFETKTLFGLNKAGMTDGNGKGATFNEPSGLSFANNKLYIADTNNNLIRVADLKTNLVSTLNLKNYEKFVKTSNKSKEKRLILNIKNITKNSNFINININFEKGYKFNNLAPVIISLKNNDSIYSKKETYSLSNPTLPLKIPVEFKKDGNAELDITFFYCKEGKESLCYIKDSKLTIPFKLTEQGKDNLEISISGQTLQNIN